MEDTAGRSRGNQENRDGAAPTSHRRADQHGTSPVYFRKICFFYRSDPCSWTSRALRDSACMAAMIKTISNRSLRVMKKEYVSNFTGNDD